MKARIFILGLLALVAFPALAEGEAVPAGVKFYTDVNARAADEFVYRDVTLANGGELASILGDEANEIDSLVVRGKVNGSDINTMREASLYGKLSVLNLEYAEIESGVIPDDAFFNFDEQFDTGTGYVYSVMLRRVILPDGITEIGDGAFRYATLWETINFPLSLKRIGIGSFDSCWRLNAEKMVLPEGLEEIDDRCFEYCEGLTGEIVLPSTIRRIGVGAFHQCRMSRMNFPASLEEMGEMAFAGTRLEEVNFEGPCNLVFDPDGAQFISCFKLKKMRLPDGVTTLPEDFVSGCEFLENIELPKSLEVIEQTALYQCSGLKSLELPEGLKRIEAGGLEGCSSLTQLVLPSTLEYLGLSSCANMAKLERIYCAALVPPVCEIKDYPAGFPSTAFGVYPESSTSFVIPVYVPRGTAELYRQSLGWGYFNNFVETDDFQTSAISNVTATPQGGDDTIYDLMGRKVLHPIKGHVYIRGGKKYICRDVY